ncbi:hypothetical protein GLYMA_12G231350v4 [Glycine max]|nr:hypothetical protein GLYMA_12G231350v4 [Glycine max]KAH1144554.1 hypothetical protein GYH30_034671 [Glycine max]
MAIASDSFMHMPMLRTSNYNSFPQKPMTMTIAIVIKQNKQGQEGLLSYKLKVVTTKGKGRVLKQIA